MSGRQILLFDLDGPLLDVSGRYYQLYADLVGEIGGRPVDRAVYWESKRCKLSEGKILAMSGLDGAEGPYQERRLALIETECYLELDRPWPGTRGFLQRLGALAPLGLVTLRHSEALLQWQLATLGLRDCFDWVLCADGCGNQTDKHDLKAGLVHREFGTTPLHGWFVGDTETDIRAGRQLGLKTAAIGFGIRTQALLELLAPDCGFETPEQLHAWIPEF
ncbi:MAG: HAD hydrolase-like protein [Desulfuromonadales bacterium]|nr:HAD hydrolase-like protein [Desulfuromonadales bacterium]